MPLPVMVAPVLSVLAGDREPASIAGWAVDGTLGGSGSISGPVNVLSGGTLAPGNSPGIIDTGDLTLDAGAAPGAHAIPAKLKYYYCVKKSGFCAPKKMAVRPSARAWSTSAAATP